MATSFITSPSSATAGSAASLQNLSSSSASLRPHHSSATTITATANVIERPSSSRNHQHSSFGSSQFTLSAKTEVPEEAAMITIQSGSSGGGGVGGGGSSDNTATNVQYLTDGEQIYATTNGQLRQYSQYVTESASPSAASGNGGSLAAGTTTYYDASGLQVVQPAGRGGGSGNGGGNAIAPKMVNSNQLASLASGMQGQLVTHQGSTYILQAPSSAVLSGSENGENGLPLQHVTRASPATVQWLLDHFEPSEGVSLARCTLYSHYRRHCAENCVEEMNAASFGKLIRSVFVNLKTRRLGTRGNSKYHYYGIRVKPTSMLNQYNDDSIYPNVNAMRGGGGGGGSGYAGSAVGGASPGKKYRANDDGSYTVDGQNNEQQNQQYYAAGSGTQAYQQLDATQQARIQEHQQYLGDPSVALTEFPGILSGNVKTTERQIELPEGISVDDLLTFESLYRDHCESILDIVVNLQFSLLESLWSSFWKRDDDGEDEMEDQLPKFKLALLCKMELIQSYMRQCDHVFYQSLVEVLIPDVLRPIPSSLTQAIRNFAKSLDGWANATLNELPKPAFHVKFAAINAFSQTLRRYTSLNHLAQAARAVLQNNGQIAQMLSDLNRVDFASVQEQAAWVCQCEDSMVTNLEKNFKVTLQAGTSLEDWASWLEAVVDQVLKTHQGSPNFAKAARQFLLKWSFYSSMVIRDLTLRSAASFGSFHLIRLLYDEYMFFLIEHKVAQSLGETPIGVMGNGGSGLGAVDGGTSMTVATTGIDLPPMTTPTSEAEETSLPRSGATLDALLIDHEMLTKPTFDISSGLEAVAKVAAMGATATSAATAATATKLNYIPTSTTINNNINANSLTASSVDDLVELRPNFGPNGVIQTTTPTEDHAINTAEIVNAMEIPISATNESAVRLKMDGGGGGQVALSGSSSSLTSSSSSTTSLVSSSSILSLGAPVGVIKQAGSGAEATLPAAAAVIASATILQCSPAAVASATGPNYVTVQAPQTSIRTMTVAAAATKPTMTTLQVIDVAKGLSVDGSEDVVEPAAKRIKTE